ncbi:MAG: FtsX-like permease family protein [Anaerovoracaceae bacterium]
MMGRLLWNDIRSHKLLSLSTVIFMAASSLLISLAVVLFTGLLGSVDGLMIRAQTPDYLQMHAGEIQMEKIEAFAEEHPEIEKWQICAFLNLENSDLRLGTRSLAGSTQDNGFCTENKAFDYLLDMNDDCPAVQEGQVYVPVCYRSLYDVNIGDKMQVAGEELVVAGFIRDSQMSSMMASSKRFLVTQTDYDRLKGLGQEEYIIEFRLKENTDTDVFAAEYGRAGLYANGPAVTKPLIRMMNALSDGLMIFVILLVGIGVLLISLLCIHFITAIGVEQDRKEVGMLKALGVGNRSIRSLYFAKYILLAFFGMAAGFLGAEILKNPLSGKLRELYGVSEDGLPSVVIAIVVCALIQGLILLYIRHILKNFEKISALEALFSVKTQRKRAEIGQYAVIGLVAAACTILALVPQNLSSTISAPDFVTYMGIGDAQIRMDVRQSENIEEITEELSEKLSADPAVSKYAALKTVNCPAFLADGTQVNLLLETGDHSVFPVTYAEGTQPEGDGEIALSSLQAEDLGLQIGDIVELERDGKRGSAVVCGIYSDITNGGKTAKASRLSTAGNEEGSSEDAAIWSILYVSLKDDVDAAQWMEEYKGYGADVVNIADYVQGTYGPTIRQIEMAKLMALGIAVLVVAVVVMLFLRLLIEKKRYSVSLQKALGFRNGSIRARYFRRGFLPVIAGVLTGVMLGNLVGEGICGQVLKSFGADGFQFVIRWEQILLIVLVLMVTAAAAVGAGTLEIKKIKAYECCMRKE